MELEKLIYSRNKLIVKVIWIFYFLDTFFYLVLDPSFDSIWPAFDLLICILVTFFILKEKWAYWGMYGIIFAVFTYLFYLNYYYPYLVNYVFIIFGLLLCSLYQRRSIIVLSTLLTISLFIYFFLTKYDVIFTSISEIDIIYFILLALGMMLFLLYSTKFTNELWEKVYVREKETRKKLDSIEKYLNLFFKNTKEAIILFDTNYKVISLNDSYKELYRLPKDINLEIQPMKQKIKTYVRLYEESTPKTDAEFRKEITDKSFDNSPLELEVNISPIYDKENAIIAYLCISRDISERKMTEKLMINSAKLKVAGELAAGITHEIRNPLTVIKGLVHLLNEEEKENKYVPIILTELERMNSIVDEFLLLAKPQQLQTKECNLVELINDVTTLFQTITRNRKIEITTQFPNNHLMYDCDGNQLKQVFINFIKNSIEAIGENGNIKIEVDTINKQTININFIDDGKGIPQDILRKIGEPFLSTKEDGTGLGMTVSKKIILAHNGTFNIVSTVGEGTKISIELPIDQE